MRTIMSPASPLLVASIAFFVLCTVPATARPAADDPPAPPPPAGPGDSGPTRADITKARDTLADLLVSEKIDRINFEAETYDQGMALIYTAVDSILAGRPQDVQDITTYTDHAAEVIGALNSHKPRGLLMTYGQNVDELPVRDAGDARMLGELVAGTASLIHEQLNPDPPSYYDISTKLFRSVILDPEEGPFLNQYLDGIQSIAREPRDKRNHYFQ